MIRTSVCEAKPLSAVSGPLPVNQRQPIHCSVGVELRYRQDAVIKDFLPAFGPCRIVGGIRHEAIGVFKIVIIAHIDDDAAVLIDDYGCSLMARRPRAVRLTGVLVGS